MKKSLLLSSAAILLIGITQNFDGQEKSQGHRQLPGGGNTGIERQSKIAQAPFFSRQGPNRWTSDHTLPYRHRMTKPPRQRDYRANATMTGKTLAQHELAAGVDTAWVRHYAPRLAPSDEEATAIAVDGSGNVYVTGYGISFPSGHDYLTMKYDSSGSQLWMARYNGPENSFDDYPWALVVDASGNVYVTGTSVGSGTWTDFATVKYNSAGVEQWVARYNGPGSGGDGANALAVDPFGNVYVTGGSSGSGTEIDYDYATVKYNSAGVEQWVARYNGPGNSYDGATALAVDASGNVYVTGNSDGSGTGFDFATVKYNSTGVEQWVARYNGPGNFDDWASALAVDASGNVYVTGTSEGSGTEKDFATIKYNSAGVEQWVARYNGPGNDWDEANALAVDASGNVYVTGGSGSYEERDYATVKYNSAGEEQWVARYNGPGNGWDWANTLAVDASGNVYVTGVSYGTINVDFATVKYNSAGVEQWVARYNGPRNSEDGASALAVDASGNVYVTGTSAGSGTGPDFATVKYNSAGVEQWVARYDGPGIPGNAATALAVDASGNVYVTGSSYGSGTGDDFATVKYNSAGAEQRVARYNGPGNDWDEANALAVDASGNVYVTGGSDGSGTGFDFATIKYNSTGVEQWVARYNGPGNDRDRANALVVDASGNVYVTGTSAGSGTGPDFATVKYNSEGIEQWVARYDGPGNSGDEATALAVDASGNVYVTGSSYGSGTRNDFATVKYDSAGVRQWVARYNGLVNSHDEATALAVDGSGNVYVTGTSAGSGTWPDFATVKYNTNGVEQWVARYYGPGNSEDRASALAVDASGNVYVTGTSMGSGTGDDFATVKYNSAGAEQWVARYNELVNSHDEATALAVDASGNVYVTGGSEGDFATVKYNSAGAEQWVARYNHEPLVSDGYTFAFVSPAALAVDTFGNVYVTGTNFAASMVYIWQFYTTIKYVQTPVSVVSEELDKPRAYDLSQNYPNPFNPATTIEFALPQASFVTLKIYDLLGNEVATLVAEKLPAGKHQRVWEAKGLASGVYLYRLEAGDPSTSSGRGFVQTKKLVLLR